MYQRRYNVTDVCLIYSSAREAIGMHRILRILWEIACRLERHAPTSFHVRIEMTGRMDLWTLFSVEIRKILISNNIHHPSMVEEEKEEDRVRVKRLEFRMAHYRARKIEGRRIYWPRKKKRKKEKSYLPPPISSRSLSLFVFLFTSLPSVPGNA